MRLPPELCCTPAQSFQLIHAFAVVQFSCHHASGIYCISSTLGSTWRPGCYWTCWTCRTTCEYKYSTVIKSGSHSEKPLASLNASSSDLNVSNCLCRDHLDPLALLEKTVQMVCLDPLDPLDPVVAVERPVLL